MGSLVSCRWCSLSGSHAFILSPLAAERRRRSRLQSLFASHFPALFLPSRDSAKVRRCYTQKQNELGMARTPSHAKSPEPPPTVMNKLRPPPPPSSHDLSTPRVLLIPPRTWDSSTPPPPSLFAGPPRSPGSGPSRARHRGPRHTSRGGPGGSGSTGRRAGS